MTILDADKEGYLRSASALVQTMGRAARHVDGHVIMYADTLTDSLRSAIDQTNRRRAIQGGVQPRARRQAGRHSESRA